jgi:hypothetical protein
MKMTVHMTYFPFIKLLVGDFMIIRNVNIYRPMKYSRW